MSKTAGATVRSVRTPVIASNAGRGSSCGDLDTSEALIETIERKASPVLSKAQAARSLITLSIAAIM